jgi:hypothetical protein
MSNSYRIRTQVGVDKSIKVYLDQDFEFLEILSLKVLQSQLYTRPCSDYGVVVGRVSVNNGFGIPNAKVSIFIPLTNEDESNPIISELYPYRKLSDVNEDGYRYNLLPYVQQHGGHTPTGTFFDRTDVLTDSTLVQVFEKYYKYTARTNDSGDFMIFGVPVGTHTIHIDIDVSDIGEFSLFPQDLIRMGRATENQVNGSRFRSSTNLGDLPQIITVDRTVEVEPLWGEEDLCNIGITRSDFDLSAGLNFKIEPTAVFMGSIISDIDSLSQKRNCKPSLRQGKLCSLITGPGEILAIRQSIFQDVNGRPGLERFTLDQGGQIIDDNGTWLVEVPMNLDYVVTNEFGELVISNDPNKGIPTKGRYRFKVKWNQPPTLREPVKRGYFLVPNIKEYGWETATNNDPLRQTTGSTAYQEGSKSYAFSLDWNDYGDSGTTSGQQMIQEAISCEDRFYEFTYNKVYTVSQFVNQYRKGTNSSRIIAIKDILDDSCESDNNKFPTNDSYFRFDIIFLLFTILIYILKYFLISYLILAHIVAFVTWIFGLILTIIIIPILAAIALICNFINLVISILNSVPIIPDIGYLPCPSLADILEVADTLLNMYKRFTNVKFPNLTYPDCELCDCKVGENVIPTTEPLPSPSLGLTPPSSGAFISQYPVSSNYTTTGINVDGVSSPSGLAQILTGPTLQTNQGRVPQGFVYGTSPTTNDDILLFTSSLPIYERLNLFNTKAKYFNDTPTNPGGGVNQIKATFNVDSNNPSTMYHLDNMLVISCNENSLATFETGKIISFQNPSLSTDINLTGLTTLNQFGTNSSTGETRGTVVGTGANAYTTLNVSVKYANPNGSGYDPNQPVYFLTGKTDDAQYHKFPIDIEYFQVITAMTYNQYSSLASSTLSNSLYTRFLNNDMRVEFINRDNGCWFQNNLVNPLSYYNDGGNQVLVFLVRGVDPYATRNKNQYDLNKLFGYSNFGDNPNLIFEGMYKPNIPIQPNLTPVQHNDFTSNAFNPSSTPNYNGFLYFESFHYEPAIGSDPGDFSGFTSTLPNYYSNLSNNTISYNPTASPASPTGPLSNVVQATSNGISTRTTPINGFNNEYSVPVSIFYDCPPSSPSNICDWYLPITNTTLVNRGYFDNEIVDGGSVMAQYYSPSYYSAGFCGENYAPYYFAGYYYTSRYNFTYTYPNTAGNNNRQIIMRSDRLPTSTNTQEILGTYSYPLQSNLNFTLFTVPDEGLVVSQNNLQSGGSPNFGGSDYEQPSVADTSVLDSLNCNKLIPLGCYGTSSGGEVFVKPTSDDCYLNTAPNVSIFGITLSEQKPVMENGCYVVLTSIFFSIVSDLLILTEWISRMQINFAACRNVWSHLFTNNWINGTLYAFNINNDRFFKSPTSSTPNGEPYSLYCKDTMFLSPSTNNYYYRSSPYAYLNQQFIGSPKSETSAPSNERNIMFPTTIMDLGPKNQFVQELVMSDEYDGYVINKLPSTTFNDVSEILNIFIINRLTSLTFLQSFFGTGGANVLSYFTRLPRPSLAVDSDYAQAISVNSELGVAPFQADNYPSNPTGQDPIFFGNGNSSERIFGIFFSSDTQIRDWISPKRTIIVQSGSPLTINSCAFNNYGTYSQVVPFSQWGVNIISDDPNIFGSQKNNWYTNSNVDQSGVGFLKYRYQSMDRLLSASRYFRPTNTLSQSFYKGHIYSVTPTSTYTSIELSPNPSHWSQNSPQADQFTVGAPFHFYFGLKKGKSAWDRFASKYLDLEVVDNG